MPKRGLSLLEIIISVIILALTAAGLVNMFISGERWAIHARSRVTGGELGRYFLDPLQMEVRQDTWDDAANPLTEHSAVIGTPQTIGNIIYTPTYTVSSVSDAAGNATGLRRAIINISWGEHNPN